jgi:hypothetical protein
VATRQGLQAQSFELAAEAYRDTVGGGMSKDSLRRITQGWGQQVEQQRQETAERANAPAQVGESPRERRVAEVEPIEEQANLSTDGGMILVRGAGWKEVKMTAISEVEVWPAEKRTVEAGASHRRQADAVVILKRHSYQAGLWDADEMALHQYSEGLRRGIDHCGRLSSVNDGAAWIERITDTNFPNAVQIVDWSHASRRLWSVGKAVLGEQTPQTSQWVTQQLDDLWGGHVDHVVKILEAMDLAQGAWPDDVRQAPGYFKTNQPRMCYARFRAEGYPIGSGTVESGINTVVHHRMRRPGRGWQRDNAQAMLAGLGELHSGRFDQAWRTTLNAAP